MLDELLQREIVLKFIKELKTNDRYFCKKCTMAHVKSIYISNEIALYIFYDALFKYKIIIDDIYLFDEYITQLERIYRKFDDFEDIRYGINKLICKILMIKLDVNQNDSLETREFVINYIYDKYILNGYYFHGFNYSYYEAISKDGFIPEEYENYYSRFIEVNKIFSKYNIYNIISKDFSSKEVFFTDDLVMGCYYSLYTPLFFYEFLTNREHFGKRIRKDAYLKDDYDNLTSHLKRFMNNKMFSDVDKKYVLDLVKDEWDLLHRKEKKIGLVLVKRKYISSKSVPLSKFLKDDSNLYDVVDRLLSSKYSNIYYDEKLEKDDFNILLFDNYYSISDKALEKDNIESDKEKANSEFLNKYGNVSVLILAGSLFITFGVIVTIVSILRG